MPNANVRKGRRGQKTKDGLDEHDDLWYCTHCDMLLVSNGSVFGCHACGRVQDVDVEEVEETREIRTAPQVVDGKPVPGKVRTEKFPVRKVTPKGATR